MNNRWSWAMAMGMLHIGLATGDPPKPVGVEDTNRLVIDLPATLRLAKAQAIDVHIAEEKLTEARAREEMTLWQFFPTITPGIGYRRHDDLIQDVSGHVIEVHKDSYGLGPTLNAQLDLGDAIYQRLAARHLVESTGFAATSQQQESLLQAVRGYWALSKAQAAVRIQEEAVGLADRLARQVAEAVQIGIAFKGDSIRAQVQTERNRVSLRQAWEQQRAASAELVRILHLAPTVQLEAPNADLVPLQLADPQIPLTTLVIQAIAHRPEVRQSHASIAASKSLRDGAKYGSWIPNLGAQVFLGGLGGGIAGEPGRFGASEDYQFTLGWRIGPGGLLDDGRINAADSRWKQAKLRDEKVLDDIRRDVVTRQTRLQSLADQQETLKRAEALAEQGYMLSTQRKEFAVGVVLEQVQAEQEWTRARLDQAQTLADFNLAQFELKWAVGETLVGNSDAQRHE